MTLYRMEKGFFKELYLIRALSWFWQLRFLWQRELHFTGHLHFLSDKQFGRGTWKILVLPRCCGDEQLLSHWVWRLQERQLLSGTFGSSGWIGFLRTVCSEFQLLSPKCKVLSQIHALEQQLWSWMGPDSLCQPCESLRSHSRPHQLVWISCCFVPTFCPPASFVFSWPFLASQQSLIFSSRDHRVRHWQHRGDIPHCHHLFRQLPRLCLWQIFSLYIS